VSEHDLLAERFEANRAHLRGVAYRMLALLALLDPDAVLRSDAGAVPRGGSSEVRGARDLAATFAGRARAAQPALVNGAAGAVWAPGGRPRVVFAFTITEEKIVAIELVADPERLARLDLAILTA